MKLVHKIKQEGNTFKVTVHSPMHRFTTNFKGDAWGVTKVSGRDFSKANC